MEFIREGALGIRKERHIKLFLFFTEIVSSNDNSARGETEVILALNLRPWI
jgi:hypothetical protein